MPSSDIEGAVTGLMAEQKSGMPGTAAAMMPAMAAYSSEASAPNSPSIVPRLMSIATEAMIISTFPMPQLSTYAEQEKKCRSSFASRAAPGVLTLILPSRYFAFERPARIVAMRMKDADITHAAAPKGRRHHAANIRY